MKIEKVNDNQIRCTLSREDLANRKIKLSELAYGSEKARELFKDMIQQANFEFGFEVEDMPLMVEAIPTSAESVILVITKCEYPEELDTRFSRFSDPNPDLMGDVAPHEKIPAKGASDIVDLFRKAYEELSKETEEKKEASEKKAEVPPELLDFTRVFELGSLPQAERLSKVLVSFYHGKSSLYKDERSDLFYLTLHKGDHSPADFNKVCNIAAEYGRQRNYTRAMAAFFEEHNYDIVKDKAVETLAQLP